MDLFFKGGCSVEEPSYNQNDNDNYYPHNSPSFLCCENGKGPHESFQCQPINQNYFEPNSSGFDQPSKYSITHQPSIIQEDLNLKLNIDELLTEQRNELFKAMQSMFEEYRQQEQMDKLSTHTTEPSRRLNSFYYDDDDYDYEESTIPLSEITSQIPSSIESDEFIKSSVEDLIPILSESEDTSESESVCILPSCDNFSPIDVPEEKSVTFSNPLFNSNDDFISSDDESLSDEDVPEDNVKIYSNPLFEFHDEYISSDVNPLFDEVLEDIECKDSYDPNLDESTFLVTPLSDSNEDEYFTPGDDVELLLHHDPSIPKMSVASILEGFTNELPLKENDDLFDLKPKNDDWKKILYDAPILMIEDKVFDPEGKILTLQTRSPLLLEAVTPDTYLIHVGNPKRYYWMMGRVLDPTAQRLKE
nr:hypothetical protein [Tanacetum cinerariifolium]